MNRQLKATLSYVTTDIRYSLTIFWMLLGGLFLFSLVLMMVIGNEDSGFSFSISFPTYIFAAIVGYTTVKNVIPYLIKMGATRNCLYIATGIYFVGLTLFNAIIANTINVLVITIFGEINRGIIISEDGEKIANFNHIADFMGGSWLHQVVIDTSISFFWIAIMFLIGLIFYRYGLIGGFSFLGLILVTIVFGFSKGWLIDFFIYIYHHFNIVLFYQLFAVGLVVYLASFLLIRKITII